MHDILAASGNYPFQNDDHATAQAVSDVFQVVVFNDVKSTTHNIQLDDTAIGKQKEYKVPHVPFICVGDES